MINKKMILSVIMVGVLTAGSAAVPFESLSPLTVTASAATTSQIEQLKSDVQTIASHINRISYLSYYKSTNTKSVVMAYQRTINLLDNAGLVVDGIFGNASLRATKDFQSRNGLTVDGMVGVGTLRVIQAKANSYIAQNTVATISFSSMYVPETVEYGKAYDIKGTVSCNKSLKAVYATVTNSSGATVMTASDTLSTGSLSIISSNLNKNIKFGSLGAGSYKITFQAIASDNTSKSVSYNFTVKSPATVTVSSSSKYNISAILTQAKNDVYTLNGQNKYREAWCADYVSDLITAQGGVSSSVKAANVTKLATNIVNNGYGKFYLFYSQHYNAAYNSAKNNKQYAYTLSGAVFNSNGIANTQLTSKSGFTVKPGDIIIFNWSNDTRGTFSHIGVVESVSGNTLTTIEGNYGSSYVTRCTRSFSSTAVVGIIRLN